MPASTPTVSEPDPLKLWSARNTAAKSMRPTAACAEWETRGDSYSGGETTRKGVFTFLILSIILLPFTVEYISRDLSSLPVLSKDGVVGAQGEVSQAKRGARSWGRAQATNKNVVQVRLGDGLQYTKLMASPVCFLLNPSRWFLLRCLS